MNNLLVSLIAIFTISCQSQPETQSPIVRDAKSDPRGFIGGSTVGNGMASYNNTTMNLNFKYPSTWSLIETSNQSVTLDDSTINPAVTSKIEFKLMPDINGTRFTSLADLKKYLTTNYPQALWKSAKLIQREGFWYETGKDSFRKGTYFLLDQNYNVMNISYEGFTATGGLLIIESIVKSLSLDYEGPQIISLKFNKKKVLPGETVTLTVQAEDELSSISPSSVKDKANKSGRCLNTHLGYRFRETTERLHKYHCKYTLNESFKIISPTVFEYSFKVPEHAPKGIIQLQGFVISDTSGNYTILDTGYPSKDKFYLDKKRLQNKIPMAEFEVLEKNPSSCRPGVKRTADEEAPAVLDMYFEKSNLYESDPIQRLYLKIQDQSDIRLEPFFASLHEVNDDSQMLCPQQNQKIKKVGTDLYVYEFDMSKCAFRNQIVAIQYASSLVDEIGNETELTKEVVFRLAK